MVELQPTAGLVDVIADVLATSGPMSDLQLAAALLRRDVDLGDDPEEALHDALDDGDGLLTVLADQRWASLPALLAGRVFTHRLTAPEVEHDLLTLNPDLEPVAMLTTREEYQRLADGSPVVQVLLPFDAVALVERGVAVDVVDEHGALLLRPGWLRANGLGDGDVIAVGVTGDGLTLDAVPEPLAGGEAVAGMRRRLRAVLGNEPHAPEMLDTAVWTACADDPALFAEPLPPLGEALDACGLVFEGEWIAAEGFDFRRWRADQRCRAIAERYGLGDDESLAVLAMVVLYEQVAELHAAAVAAEEDGGADALVAFAARFTEREEPAPDGHHDARSAVRAVLPLLADPAVAQAVLAETVGAARDGAAALGLFAETLEPLAPRVARPALRWLRGRAHERLGDVVPAEEAYLVAESLDPDWSPALIDLARYAGDRGDAARGLALLRRARVPRDHELVELLEQFQVAPRSDLGRNEPCWCGSGRKYKKCHLNNERLPLDERVGWLYQKAYSFLAEGPWRSAMMDAAQVRSQHSDDRFALLSALSDPLVTDAILFEGGAFAEFVSTRGALLPDDERLLAEQWLLVERSVYEVEQVRRGEGITVRDVRTGDVHPIRERTASRQLKAGALICARVVPAGDSMQIFGGIEPVVLHERDELIALLDSEPDPVDLVAFLSRRFAPPAMHNAEGEPLVLCEVTLKTGDPAGLTAELDETYDRDDSGSQQWLEHVTADSTRYIRATVRLDGNDLRVEANSAARVDRVLDTLHALDPTLTVVDQSRRPARDAREAAALLAESPPAGADASHSDPAVTAALEAFIRDYEQKWIDQPIPALAGHTPRQAAADPTRRGDLIRLIDSFPSGDGNPGTMNPDRLRTDLELR